MTSAGSVSSSATHQSVAQASIDSGNGVSDSFIDGKKNRNPKGISLIGLIKEDFETYERAPFAQGFWTLFWHRFGNARMSIRPKLLRLPFSLVYKFGFKLSEWFCGMSIPYTIPVGRRVILEHFGGLIVSAKAIGDDVVLRQNTTCGVLSVDRVGEIPTLGDGVDVGVGVAILGDVKIGKNARIGANAVVVHDVASDTTVVGIPARPIQSKPAGALNVADPRVGDKLKVAPTKVAANAE